MILLALVVAGLVVVLLLAGRGSAWRPGGLDARHAGAILVGVAAVGVFEGVIIGLESGPAPAVLALVLVVPLVGLAILARRVPAVAERSWSAPTPGQPCSTLERSAPPSPWSVARALGRVEARELTRSPWFGVGIGFCVLLFVLFGFAFGSDNGDTWDGFVQLAPWFAHPLVGMAALAGHRAATRATRDGADELFDSCPTDPSTRTVGFLLAAATPVATLIVFLTAVGAVTGLRSAHLHGPLGGDNVADVLGAVVLGAGGLALGVALGRWVCFSLAPLAVIAGIALLTLRLNSIGDPGWNPLAPLSTAPALTDQAPIFTDRAAWWHLAWLLALTTLVGAVAVARHRHDRTVAAVGAVAVSVALVAAIGATRPMSPATAARIADLIARPAAHQDCVTTGSSVQVCVYRAYGEQLDRVVERVRPIADALPARRATITLRQSFNVDFVADLSDLPPEVRHRLPDGIPRPAAGDVPLDFSASDSGLDRAAFDLAFTALELPLKAGSDLVPTVIAGQARGVVALWLATRGLDADQARVRATSATPESSDPFDRGSIGTDACNIPSVVWSAQDLAAARAVLAATEADVARTVQDEWARWADPATGTDELLAALGLGSAGPFDEVVARPGSSC